MRIRLDRAGSSSHLRRISWPWELLVGGVGGIMALMLGYSLVCVVEMVYFFTVRWYDNAVDPTLNKDDDSDHAKVDNDAGGDNILWRTASDTDLVATGQTVRFDSPVLYNTSETRKVGICGKSNVADFTY